ncbi:MULTISPECIES: spore cortex biosynthesis protein YabQ [Clostridium]|jgi:spore cortex biosynthesis protein YabQ|uniref:spore cortex biosynthesis protein YabQ n=1 Tax=Clostridium TaxID=1485 RepID=UPI00028A1DBD|nr:MULTISPECIES: spore cortex biosynthesis protein YabQ [Clostridium]MDF2502969.1 spore cortex biosynthesis protein YabQ [Clostridium sp.]
MVLSNFIQFNLLFYSFIAGIFTGILFDIYRVMRGLEVPNKFIGFIEDLLFWILTAIIIFIFLLYSNDAIMGIYVYLFIGIGVYIYIKLLSKKLMYIEVKMMRGLARIIRIIFKLMVYPFRLLFDYFLVKDKNKE